MYIPVQERCWCNLSFDHNQLPHVLSMDNPKKPDLKRKLVVVGDGSSALSQLMAEC